MAVPPETILLDVISWLLFLKVIQTAFWPPLEKVLGRYGYPAAYTASVLVFTALSWYLALAGLPVPLAAVPFLILLAVQAWKGCYRRERWQGMWKWDLIFLIAFLVMAEMRYVNPSIAYAEKFMDHAFLASIMRTPMVPPLDPWFTGGSLNVYYYLGYWMAGAIGLTTAVPSSVVFNLAIPTVVGLAVVNLWMVGDLLLPRLRWLPVTVLLLVNPSFLMQSAFQLQNILGGGTFSLMDLVWKSTRTITNTITEFPLFSFLWGDPHPHVLAIGNQAFLIFLLGFLFTRWQTLNGRTRAGLALLVALSLGSMPPFNSWDVLVYAPFTLLILAVCGWQAWKAGQGDAAHHALAALVLVPVASVALYLPYYLQMAGSGILGVFPVPTPSDPVQFLLVHGFFLAVILLVGARGARTHPVSILPAIAGGVLLGLAGYAAAGIAAFVLLLLFTRKDRDYPLWLAAAGLCLLILTELLYLKDHFGTQAFRLNTVFKFSFIAWMMLGTAAMVFIGRYANGLRLPERIPDKVSRVLAVIAVILVLILPLILHVNFSYSGGTLDGLAFLDAAQPGDAAALEYLSHIDGDEVIVEAVKGDYGYYSRISAFTGIPAVVGSPFHEFMWRGGNAGVMARVADVKAMYEEPSRRGDLVQKYRATLLYVGDAERVLYPSMDLSGGGLTPVYEARGVTIYRFTEGG
jgi:YYY domain-containing protein